MKRIICLITILCIVFNSFSFCFGVDWSSTDQQNLSNTASRLYYNNQSAAYYLYQIYTRLGTLSNTVTDIKNALFDGNHSIAWWANSINSWLSPIYNSLTSIPVDNSTIIGALGYYDTNNTYHPYLNNLNFALSSDPSGMNHKNNAHNQLSWTTGNWYSIAYFNADGSLTNQSVQWTQGTPIGNLAVLLNALNGNAKNIGNYIHEYLGQDSSTSQNITNWSTLNNSTFTPVSATDGIYKYLAAIQTPVARLSYVLASDERLEAQEAAAENEEAVVNNFIDSTGDGSASPSDIGSISDLSSGYKSNFGSDASVTGIFNIFNSNNMGWFSQETANQLDTTTPTRRGSSFDTPLLDQQIEDIYDQIGVKHD